MQNIINLGQLPATSTTGGETFGSALQALAHGADPDLRFGRLTAQGLGSIAVPGTITLILRAGTLTLEGAAADITLHPGEAALIGKGTSLAWSAQAADFVVICDFAAEPRNLVAKPDLTQALGEGSGPNPALLRSAMPTIGHQGFMAEAELSCGLWSATPYDRAPMVYPLTEAMYLLEGTVTPYDDAGNVTQFTKGDVFIILTGATAGWRNLEPVRKLYIISQRKG
jgi:uncharacterized cupin superfamily protein